jgi:hypothetical protein
MRSLGVYFRLYNEERIHIRHSVRRPLMGPTTGMAKIPKLTPTLMESFYILGRLFVNDVHVYCRERRTLDNRCESANQDKVDT